ncbi:MAG: hypothetical protein ACI4D2_01185 [Lachnospiraceae bacterium]
MSDMFILKAFKCDKDKILQTRGLEKNGEVQKYIDSECLRLSESLVPKDVGNLIQSGTINTQIGTGEVKYRTPYARRWYYMPANFNQGSGSGMNAVGRGNYWFERMKQRYKENILRGARRIAGAGG